MSKYDVAIIGSGLGGLLSGYILSREGLNVCALEKNSAIGGCLQTFTLDGSRFDAGGHYAGGLDEGQNLWRYFKYFGLIGKLNIKKLDEASFDIISFGDEKEKEYKYSMGYHNFVETLNASFPDEKETLEKYVTKIKEVKSSFPLFNLEVDRASLEESSRFVESIGSFLEDITKNRRLQNVLAGSNLLYAGVPDKTPLYIHALITGSFIESAWRFAGGCSQIPEILADSIREMGGTVLTDANVVKFNFNGDNISSAELTGGEKIEAVTFLSNIHPARTLELIEPSKVRSIYRSRIMELENTTSVFSLYITLKKNSFRYINANHYFYKKNNVWTANQNNGSSQPESFLFITPASTTQSAYADSITVLSYMNYNEVKKWENTKINSRGEEYLEFKEKKAQQLFDLLEMKFPGLRENVKSYHSSTPLSYRDYTGSKEGSLYGILKDSNNPIKTMILAKTKIPNLLFTGQNLKIHGILGVTIGAVLTCGEMLGLEYLVNKIKAES